MASPEGQSGGTQQLDGVRILLVDDDPDGREVVALMLEHYGATVTRAASATEAFQALQREQPDVLVSDIAMPEQSGLELIAEVRAMPPERGGQIPAAALTSYTSAEDQERVLAAGFNLHIPKPVDQIQLTMAIAALVGRGPGSSEAGGS